jgi:protein tyrosine/serine phosphatase
MVSSRGITVKQALLIVALLVCGRAFAGDVPVFDNFHEVERGELYRSAQMGPKDLGRRIRENGIRTIINLRGAAPGEEWFERETEVAEQAGVKMYNIGFTAERIPTAAELGALLAAFDEAPRPILVHCRAGADRTGEAVAVYLFDQSHGNRKKAEKALSIRYFHLELAEPAMDYFIRHVYQGEVWAKTYDPCNENYKYFNKTALCGPQNTKDAN